MIVHSTENKQISQVLILYNINNFVMDMEWLYPMQSLSVVFEHY